jgi:hypothetical protein
MRKDCSPFAALALARAAKRVAMKHHDPELLQDAEKWEAEAQDEINKLKAAQKLVFTPTVQFDFPF